MNIKKPLMYIFGVTLIIIGFVMVRNNYQKKAPSIPNSNESELTSQQVTSGDETEDKELSRYVEFSPSTFTAAKDKKRVYFFHAKWCETCIAANKEFTKDHDKIPADVVLFKTDYDTEKELKKKYAIPYQHTFVYVDKDEKQISRWTGGGIDDLVRNTQ